MEYSEKDKQYVENMLNKCVKIAHDDFIYYATNPNIIRQLKYNRLLNKKEIIIDLTKIYYKDIILKQDLKFNSFNINNNLWLYFESKYNVNYKDLDKYHTILIQLNDILCDIIDVEHYTLTNNLWYSQTESLSDKNIFKTNKILLKIN